MWVMSNGGYVSDACLCNRVMSACSSLSQKCFLEKSLAKEKKSMERVAPGFASRGFDPRPERDIWGIEFLIKNTKASDVMHTRCHQF
jgi:hypothetical protein